MALEKEMLMKTDRFNNLNLTRGRVIAESIPESAEERGEYTLKLYFQQRNRTDAKDRGRPIDKIEETFDTKPIVIAGIMPGTTLLNIVKDLEQAFRPVSDVRFTFNGKPCSKFPESAPYFTGCKIKGADFYGSEINTVVRSGMSCATGGRFAGFRWEGVNWLYFIGKPAKRGERGVKQHYPDELLSQFVFCADNKYIQGNEISITLSFEKMSFNYEVQFSDSNGEIHRVFIIKKPAA